MMNRTRKIFNKLHEELSLKQGKFYPRWELYNSLSDLGFDPNDLSTEDTAIWCRAHGHINIAGKMRKFNPDSQTPEDIFQRIFFHNN